MKTLLKMGVLVCFVATAFTMAWFKSYNMSLDYFNHAESMRNNGDYVTALKGMNKLELRRTDAYLGGYQQVIETWEETRYAPRPDFFFEAKERVNNIFVHLSTEELLNFIEIYVELDMRYVPAAALVLLERAKFERNNPLALEMEEFLWEAFPTVYVEHIASVGTEYPQVNTNIEAGF
ncbi:hypothetical protein RCJ22_15395 [Vibrio sp. FNV 38]|nr:hypothetical protein [Vibrio sp. FNV 38]